MGGDVAEAPAGGLTIKYRHLRPYKMGEIKVLLLENVSSVAVATLREAGYHVECDGKALSPPQLIERLKEGRFHVLGVRSKTRITEEVIREAPCLLAIGCFCIGTNQVDLQSALSRGVAVFNSPFSNSRSVAELVICEVIALSRQLADRSAEMHRGVWCKTAAKCREVRGKTLGIVGYGHIGAQLSVLAEAMGMRVIFYDVQQIMPIGMASPVASLRALLAGAHFVTLHVPESEETIGMIGREQIFEWMPRGAYLINASRGSVVDLAALKEALEGGHLAGAALDVYPEEPEANGAFSTGLQACPNLVMTPHIGGSTEEAQAAIGLEVAQAMVRFLELGTTLGSVNFPELQLRPFAPPPARRGVAQAAPAEAPRRVIWCRLLNVHRNVPGVLRKINDALADFNIEKQVCESLGSHSYIMADIVVDADADLDVVFQRIYDLPEAVATRIVY